MTKLCKTKILLFWVAASLAHGSAADESLIPPLGWPDVARSQLGFSIQDHGINSSTAVADHENWLGRPYAFHNTYSINYDYLVDRNNGQLSDKQVVVSVRLGWSQGANDQQLPASAYALLPRAQRVLLVRPTRESHEIRRQAFADVVNGKWDERFTSIAKQLVEAGHKNAIIRLGHEFNAHWSSSWSLGLEDEYIAAFRRAVTVLRDGSQDFVIDWNPSRVTFSAYAIPAYPGDEWVDVIGMDSYCQEDYNNPRDRRVFEDHIAFAIKRDKPVSYPEWGLWDTDDTNCIDFYYELFNSLPKRGVDLLYHSYFNMLGGGHHQLGVSESGVVNPLATQRFLQLFGGPQPVLKLGSHDLEFQNGETLALTIANHGNDPLSIVALWANAKRDFKIVGDGNLNVTPGTSEQLSISHVGQLNTTSTLILYNSAGKPHAVQLRSVGTSAQHSR